MRKLKLFMTALALTGGVNAALAQTDVTSTYLTNADFSQGTPIDNHLCGYGGDMEKNSTTYYGFQGVTGWTSVVLSGDNSNATYPNTGMGGAVFAYGSNYQMKGNNVAAPATNPGGEATGNALGFFAVWGCGGYYYQDVTFPAGKYTLTFPIYCQSGTQANETQTGFFPTSGTNRTVAINTTVGSWVNQTVSFTLTAETAGQIRIGYKSTGSGSAANPMLFFDGVKIEFTAVVVKDVLSTAITAATNANATLNSNDLTTAIATAQSVYDNENATQDEVNAAAATLNAATELAMSAVGDVTGVFLANPGFESCTAETSNVAAKTKKDYSSAGWTNANTGSFTTIAVTAYGSNVNVANSTTPSTKKDGTTVSGNTLGIIAGWGDNVTIQSNDVTLPAGVYTLTVDHYLTSTTANYGNNSSKFGFVTSGNSYLVSNTTFSASTWTTETVTFTLTESTTGKIQIGLTGLNKSGSDSPAVFYDDIAITYKSFLDGAKEAWGNAVAAAQTAITENPNVTGEELTALNAELAKAEPTTLDGYNAATDALTTATTTLTSAAAAYNALAAVNGMITAAGELQYADQTKKPSAEVTATSATDANTKTTSQYTALRAYYESNAKAEGVEGAVDYSSAIAAANADTNTGWTKGVGTNQGQGYTDSEGNVAAKYLDGGWASNAACNVDMTRTVEVPAGTYLLTVKARGAVDLTEYTLSIADKTINLPHSNGGSNGVFGNGWEDASVEFESDGTAQTLEVIAKSTANQQWFSMNDFRLVQLELNSGAYAGETEYTALNSAIEAAEAKTLGFEDGQYAPYNNVAAIEALAAAKAIDQTAELTNLKTTVEAITTALTDATWTVNDGDVEAIFNGTFAETGTGNNPKGWTRSNNGWGQQITDLTAETNGVAEGTTTAWYYNNNGAWQYGNDGVYTMPLAANTKYVLKFKYSKHGGDTNNWMKASVLNENNEGLDVVQYPGASDNTMYQSASAYFTTGAAGNYILSIEQNGNAHLTDVSLVKTVSTEYALSEGATAAPSEMAYYETVALTRTLKANIWNTFSVPFDMEIPGNWTVKEFDTADGSTLNFKAATEIVAGKPYLVKTDGEDYANLTFKGVVVKATEGETVGDETGYKFAAQIYNKELATDGTVAYLATDGTIKKLTSGGIKGLRAYFIIPANADPEVPARIAFVDEGGTTAIESVASETVNAENGIYDLQGRRVNAAKKGLYIINGKKVVK